MIDGTVKSKRGKIQQQLTLVNDSSTVVSIGYALHRYSNSVEMIKISISDDRMVILMEWGFLGLAFVGCGARTNNDAAGQLVLPSDGGGNAFSYDCTRDSC